jgi:integrase
VSIHKKPGKRGTSYQVQWRDSSGKQRAKRFLTRKDAETYQSKLNIDKYRGYLPNQEGNKIKFSEYAVRWVKTKDFHRPRTAKRRDEIIRIHLIPVLGNRTLTSISPADINDLIMQWQQQGLKPRTVKNHMHILGPILEMAVTEELILRNPTKGIVLEEPVDVKRYALTAVEVNQLIHEIPEHFKPFVQFALLTGMRFNELVDLKIGDIHVNKSLVRVLESKTDAGVRDIQLSQEELTYLKTFISQHRSAANKGDLLFVSVRGCRIGHSNFVNRVFKPAVQRAGLEYIRPHDLRRTNATALVESGMTSATVRVRMGHESSSTTDRYYVIPTIASQTASAGVASQHLKLNLLNSSE